MGNTPVEVQFTSAGCLNYPCRTSHLIERCVGATISPHRGRGSADSGGGSFARAKTVVRKLYLPLGGRRFRSLRAYRLACASQREAVNDRAMRRARKLCRKLGGDPTDDCYPENAVSDV
jgi:hypothetical protein